MRLNFLTEARIPCFRIFCTLKQAPISKIYWKIRVNMVWYPYKKQTHNERAKQMKKFEGILICTDLDGTLLRDDKSISKKNLEAIEYFKSEGGYFTFITGRLPYFVQNIYNTVKPNVPFGWSNGGAIYDHREKKYIYSEVLSK